MVEREATMIVYYSGEPTDYRGSPEAVLPGADLVLSYMDLAGAKGKRRRYLQRRRFRELVKHRNRRKGTKKC